MDHDEYEFDSIFKNLQWHQLSPKLSFEKKNVFKLNF